jgi:hypothetical protein
MRLLSLVVFLGSIMLGSWWLWHHSDTFRNLISEYVDNGEFYTLEARFTSEQIMNLHKNDLLTDADHSFVEPSLKFHPYLLLDVKYSTPDKKSKENVILWGMVDGEMVLNTETWEKTHGFEDAIQANTTRTDFKILNALARSNGTATKEQLQKELHLEPEVLEPWIESTRQKHLVIQKGNLLQLHFQNPKILVNPQTKINHWLVTKPYNHAQRVSAKYSQKQIEKVAQAAFGSDFTIRSTKIVFLPVYGIDVLNPDGSIMTTFWNALNGKRIHPKYFEISESPQ